MEKPADSNESSNDSEVIIASEKEDARIKEVSEENQTDMKIKELDGLLKKLVSESIGTQVEAAAKEIRLLTESNPSSLIYLGKSEKIEELLTLWKLKKFYWGYHEIIESLITVIWKISSIKENRSTMLDNTMMLEHLIECLKQRNWYTRDKAALTLYSLSSESDDAKIAIVKLGAFEPLLGSLQSWHPQCMISAGDAICSLCIPEQNKERAIMDGVLAGLYNVIMGGQRVGKFLEVVAWLSNEPRGMRRLASLDVVRTLMLITEKGATTDAEKESCLIILFNTCLECKLSSYKVYVEEVDHGTISKLAENGTEEGKNTAKELIELVTYNHDTFGSPDHSPILRKVGYYQIYK